MEQKQFDGKIPEEALTSLETELAGLIHGTAILEIHIKDGKLARYVTGRERSYIPGRLTTGSAFTDANNGKSL